MTVSQRIVIVMDGPRNAGILNSIDASQEEMKDPDLECFAA